MERENSGIEIKWLPGICCMEQRRKKNSEDCLWVRVRNVLFADDTTILATSNEMEKDKETTKYNMNPVEKIRTRKKKTLR